MTSQGTARGRFQRAIHSRHVQNAEMAAREMGGLSLAAGGAGRFGRRIVMGCSVAWVV
jgi:hypothetical protein